MDYGQRNAATVMSARLKAMFHDADVDWSLVADDLVETISMGAIDQMNAHDAAMQEAITATMRYMQGIAADLRERVASLELERATLQRQLRPTAAASLVLTDEFASR